MPIPVPATPPPPQGPAAALVPSEPGGGAPATLPAELWRETLPWFLFIGRSGSGRRCLLDACGFPAGEGRDAGSDAPRPPIEIRSLDRAVALVPDAGVILAEPGSPEERGGWRRFLRAVRSVRPRPAWGGVVVTLSLADLDGARARTIPELLRDGQRLHARIDTLCRVLHRRLPVHLVVTKCDLLPGFAPFWASQPVRRHDEILGWTLPGDTAFAGAGRFVDRALAAVQAGLDRAALERTGPLRGPDDPALDLPEEMAALRAPLSAFVDGLTRGRRRFLPRGIAFTGALVDDPLAPARPILCADLLTRRILPDHCLAVATGTARRLAAAAVVAGGLVAAAGGIAYGVRTDHAAAVAAATRWHDLEVRLADASAPAAATVAAAAEALALPGRFVFLPASWIGDGGDARAAIAAQALARLVPTVHDDLVRRWDTLRSPPTGPIEVADLAAWLDELAGFEGRLDAFRALAAGELHAGDRFGLLAPGVLGGGAAVWGDPRVRPVAAAAAAAHPVPVERWAAQAQERFDALLMAVLQGVATPGGADVLAPPDPYEDLARRADALDEAVAGVRAMTARTEAVHAHVRRAATLRLLGRAALESGERRLQRLQSADRPPLDTLARAAAATRLAAGMSLFTDPVPPRAVLRMPAASEMARLAWDGAVVERMAGMGRERAALMTIADRLPEGWGEALADRADAGMVAHLAALVPDAWRLSAAPPGDAAVPAVALLGAVDALERAGLQDAAHSAAWVLLTWANRRLEALDRELEAVGPYRAGAGLARWDGRSPPLRAAFGAAAQADPKGFLAEQRRRLAEFRERGREITAVLADARFADAMADSPLLARWIALGAALDGRDGADLARLDGFIATAMAEPGAAVCAGVGTSVDDPAGGAFTAERLAALRDALARRCLVLADPDAPARPPPLPRRKPLLPEPV